MVEKNSRKSKIYKIVFAYCINLPKLKICSEFFFLIHFKILLLGTAELLKLPIIFILIFILK